MRRDRTQARALGHRVRALREACGWSIRRLAAKAGVDADTVSRLEHGHKPELSLWTAVKLAGALGVRVDTLAGVGLATPAEDDQCAA